MMNTMKLRSSRTIERQEESPFLPLTGQANGDRPRLKFDSPEKTEEWLASREKTDYTYSRSTTYTTGASTGYQVPIMSRLSQGSILRDTSLQGIRGQFQREASASPNRRSSRLAKKTSLNESSLNQSQTRSVQVGRNTRHSTTNLHTVSSHDYHGNEDVSGEDSVWPSSASTMASSASHMASLSHQGQVSGVTARGGMYHQVHHSGSREHSISHMYGLDANDESELSDTESSSAVMSGVSSRTSGRWSSASHAHQTHQTHQTKSSSALFFPVSWLITIVTSVVSVVTTATHTSYLYLARAVYGSSTVDSMNAVSTKSSSRIVYIYSSLVQLVSVAMYRCVTYIMCADVWWLIITRTTTLRLLGFLASFVGLGSAGQADRSAAAAMLQKKRKRRSCCLCLLLLLGSLVSAYLLLAAAPFLLAAVSRNETKTDSPLHTVNEQLGLLLGKMGSDDDGGAAAFIAGSGCLQCLKADDLAALIGVIVKGQMGDLQSEVASQKQQILVMQHQRVDQEMQIKNLQDQLSLLIAQQERPNDHTLLYINSMEGQLTRVRGQLRNLQLSRLRAYQDTEKDGIERSVIIVGLSDDLQTLGKEVSGLQTELEKFRTQQVQEMNKAHQESDKVHSLHVGILSWEERLTVNVTFLESKLKGLLNEIEILKSDRQQSGAKLEELVDRVNSFEVSLVDVKTDVRILKSEFGDLLVLQNKKEEKSEAVYSSLELLRTDFASFRISNGDTIKSLNELQNKYQTVGMSLGGMQTDVKLLQASLEDLTTNQVGVFMSNIKQLNTKLAKLDSDFGSLRANFLTLQGAASGRVDKNGLDGLHLSITKTEEQVNVFATDVDSLKIQVIQLRNQLDDVRTSHEEHRSQAGAALRDLKSDIGELNIKSERMVVLENIQGNADSDSLVKQLSGELRAVRLDLRRVSSLEGDSDLVTEVNTMRSSLTSAKSQISYFDTTQMQMTRTFTSSISDLRDSVSQVNQAVKDQSAAVISLNSTVVSLKLGQDKLTAFATRKQLEDLEAEMTNVKVMIAKLTAAQSVFASTGDIEALKKELTNVKLQVDTTQVHLTEMSNTYLSDASSYTALAADLAKMQGTVKQLEAMLCNDKQQPINVALLESRINDLASLVEDNNENLAAFLAVGGTRGTAGSSDAIVALQKELAALKSNTDRLSGLLYIQGVDDKSANVIATLQDRVSSLEASLAQMKASGVGAGGGYDVKFQKLQGDINSLKEDMMRQTALHSTGAGLGVLGATIQDDMKEAKANITRLQVDVYKCCKNKTGLLGWWSSPWFSQGSSANSINLNASGDINEEAVKYIVLSALNMYSADKTGMVDYALESAGGSVISTRCSETHYSKTALLSIFGIPLWYMANSPRTVIQPDVQPGNCWAFKGSQGYIVIQLAGIIKASAFSMEHIPKSLSPTGTIDSAPKEFSVWGLSDEDDTGGVLLGEYVYDQDGSPLQFFAIERNDVEPIPAVELKIHSNHGNLEYTCLYRFRVHGTLDRR